MADNARVQRMEKWLDNYADIILRTCFLYLCDADYARDAMQDTFFKAWRAMGQYEKKHVENDKAWLLRIAINVCRDYRRNAWFKHVDRRCQIEEMTLPTSSAAQRDWHLLQDVLQLPDQCRQAVILYYYHDMTLEETAKLLHQPRSTVHKRLQKALQLLKDGMEEGE